MIKRIYDNINRLIILAGLCVLLVGCDGGIFGTGDGSADPFIVDGVDGISASDSAADSDSSSDSDLDTGDDNEPGTAPSTDNETSIPSSAEVSTPTNSPQQGSFTTDFIATEDAVASNNGQLSFTNLVVIEDDITEIALVNDTDMNIGLFASQDIDAISLGTLPPGNSGIVSLMPSADVLYFEEITENNERISRIVIDPLTVANGSRTLTVLTNTAVGVRLLAMPSYNVAETSGVVPQRFVFPFLAGDPAVPSIITLTPNPAIQQSTELEPITFGAINSDLPITNYLNVPPGEYLLSDNAGRYSNVSIQVRESDNIITTVFDSDGTSARVNIDF